MSVYMQSSQSRAAKFQQMRLHDGSVLSWVCKYFTFFLFIGTQAIVLAAMYILPWLSVYFLGLFSACIILTTFRFTYYAWKSLAKVRRAYTDQELRSSWEDIPLGVRRAVTHFVMFPNYKEDESTLFNSLQAISQSPMASELIIVLAMEEREGKQGEEKAARIMQSFKGVFANVFSTFHPANIPGEIPGKCSNENYAYRKVLEKCIVEKINIETALITVVDSDVLLNPLHFNALTLDWHNKTPLERHWSIWSFPQLQVRNYWNVPSLSRVSQTGIMLYELAGFSGWWTHPLCSTYSVPLSLLEQIEGWDSHVVTEDFHLHIKASYANARARLDQKLSHECDCKEIPKFTVSKLHLPMWSYTLEGSDWKSSMVERAQQAYRHALSVLEVAYFFHQWCRMLIEYGRHFLFSREQLSVLPLVTEILFQTIPCCLHTLSVPIAFTTLLYYYGFWGVTFPCNDIFPEAQSLDFVAACRVAQFYPLIVTFCGLGMILVMISVLEFYQISREQFTITELKPKRFNLGCKRFDPENKWVIWCRMSAELAIMAGISAFCHVWLVFSIASFQLLKPNIGTFNYKTAVKPVAADSKFRQNEDMIALKTILV